MTRNDVIRLNAAHIRRVGEFLVRISNELNQRAINHDASKWSEEEWPYFEKVTPKFAGVTYGSDEYKAIVAEVKPANEHHNKVNRHHPEHFANGINDMTLLDLIEMMCDWKAASERSSDGTIARSIEHNKKRLGIEPQLLRILENTCREQGWMPPKVEPSQTTGYAGRDETGGSDF